jgi:hypothetical protein
VNDISPVRVGQTTPACHWNFKDSLGNVVSMPSGTVFTQFIYNTGTGLTATGLGSFSIVDLSQGQVDYLWDARDSAVAGSYLVYAGYALPNNGGQGFTDTIEWIVQPITLQQ